MAPTSSSRGYAYAYIPPAPILRPARRAPLTRGDLTLRIVMAVAIAAALFFALASLTTPTPALSAVQCAVCFACAAGYAGVLILCRPAE